MFIDILNIANKTFTGISFGLGGSLLGTFLLSDLKKEIHNDTMLHFSPFNKGTIYGFFIGFFIGYRCTKKIEYSY